jgi:hypothetical protein
MPLQRELSRDTEKIMTFGWRKVKRRKRRAPITKFDASHLPEQFLHSFAFYV